MKLLRFPKLSEKLGGRSRASVFRDMRTRNFPKPVQIGLTAVAWSEEAVDAWIAELIAAEPKKKPVAPGSRRGRKAKGES